MQIGRADLSVLGRELLDQLLKGCQLFPINQIKLLEKKKKSRKKCFHLGWPYKTSYSYPYDKQNHSIGKHQLTHLNDTSTHLNKEDKVLERGVEVRLLLQLDNRVKVLVIDVSVNTEESLQNGLGHRHEVLRKRDPYKCHRKTTLK